MIRKLLVRGCGEYIWKSSESMKQSAHPIHRDIRHVVVESEGELLRRDCVGGSELIGCSPFFGCWGQVLIFTLKYAHKHKILSIYHYIIQGT